MRSQCITTNTKCPLSHPATSCSTSTIIKRKLSNREKSTSCFSSHPAQGNQKVLEVQELNGVQVTRIFGGDSSSLGNSSRGTEGRAPQPHPDQSLQNRAAEAIKAWFLPAGYPGCTTPDYLEYQLIAFPTHVLGWLAHSLITSSLFSAVGLSAGPAGAVATSAGIKWITKDGIGTLGRFFVGGRLAEEFDNDPRYWRMVAEFVSTLGAGLEIATVAYPQQFLLLASAGNFTHALSKSLGRPVFRVIQTHFAATNNVGAVAAKEEVWEVSAELVGTVSSLALLTGLASLPEDGPMDMATVTMATWAFVQAIHVGLRYLSMKTLQFPSMSDKRVRLLVTQHVQGQPLSSVKDANKAEPIFELRPWVCFPVVHLATESIQQCLQQGPPHTSPETASGSDMAQEVSYMHALGHDPQIEAGATAAAGGAPGSSQPSNLQPDLPSTHASMRPSSNHAGSRGTSSSSSSSSSLAFSAQPSSATSESIQQPPCQAGNRSRTHPADVSEMLQRYLQLYSQEQHVLVWRGGEAHVLLHEDAGPHAALQAMWQAAWLHRHAQDEQGDQPPSSSLPEAASVHALRQQFPSFLQQAADLGYELDRVTVQKGAVRVRIGKQQPQ